MEMINVSEIEKLYKKYNDRDIFTLSIGSGEDKFEFQVKHRLSADEATYIVTSVCNGVIDANTGTYHSELKDYYLRMAVLKTYANISLPESDRNWALVYGTPIFAMITGYDKRPVVFDGRDYDDNIVIDVEQYEKIITAIDQKITYALYAKK